MSELTAANLESCSFCGSQDVYLYWGDCNRIHCHGCDIDMRGDGGQSKEVLFFRWNNRGKWPDSKMDNAKALIESKFTSGSSIPVDRITITRAEWDRIND